MVHCQCERGGMLMLAFSLKHHSVLGYKKTDWPVEMHHISHFNEGKFPKCVICICIKSPSKHRERATDCRVWMQCSTSQHEKSLIKQIRFNSRHTIKKEKNDRKRKAKSILSRNLGDWSVVVEIITAVQVFFNAEPWIENVTWKASVT